MTGPHDNARRQPGAEDKPQDSGLPHFAAAPDPAQVGSMRSDWHRVGAGLSVQFTFSDGAFNAEWSPRLPTKREMKRVLDRYRGARHFFLAELARRIGGTVAVVEAQP